MGHREPIGRPDGRALNPLQWGETLLGEPVASVRLTASAPILVRRWRGVCPDIEQPPLDHHYITLHLGGAKRIRRTGEGREAWNEIAEGAYSVTPAGSAFRWRTEGPVDFVHLYLRPSSLDEVIAGEFDRDARRVALHDALGARDPLLEALMGTLADSLTAEKRPSRLYWDGVAHTLTCRLLSLHSTVATTRAQAPHILAPARVERVLAFMDANLATDIALSDLAAVAGVSVFHFIRGFRQATGRTPYECLIHRRLERAKALLRESDLPLSNVARACGFNSAGQFSVMFKRVAGVCPSRYRARQ